MHQVIKEVKAMLRELIDKLKSKKQQLQKHEASNDVIETKQIEEEKEIDIKVSKQGNIYKIEISDYISIIDFVDKKNSSDEYKVLDLLCNYVLWNGSKQKVNKGTYYVINTSNCLYNILFTDDTIDIEERIKIELDEQTQKENIIEERLITFNIDEEKYRYYTAKHEQNRNTYYTKYYDKNRTYSLGALDLSEEEALSEIKEVFYNLEGIEGINNILDIELLKSYIADDLRKINPIKIRKK